MKDERNHHSIVDKSFLEQQIRNVDVNYILCEKIGPIHVAEPGLTVGRQAGRQVPDEIQVNLDFFKNHCTSIDSPFTSFNQVTASLQ